MTGEWLSSETAQNIAQAEDLHQRGQRAHTEGDLEGAIGYYQQVLQLIPQPPRSSGELNILFGVFNNMGVALRQLGKTAEAIVSYQQALALCPDDVVVSKAHQAQTHHNLGNALQENGQTEAAISHYRQALQLNPHQTSTYQNLGGALRELAQTDAAIECYRQLLALEPHNSDAYNNLGNAFREQGKQDEAISAYEKALAENPHNLEAKVNMGNVYTEAGNLATAISYYQQAIHQDPNSADAQYNLGVALLLSGNLRAGFAGYEWRWGIKSIVAPLRRSFSQPRWDGSPLEGKTILLYAEQGFGDTIQFCRYVPIVAAMGGKVIIECPSPLVRLLQNLPGADQIIPFGSQLPDFDCQASLMSLPHILGTTLETIPHDIPYLKVRSWASAQKMNEHPEGLKPNYEPQLKIGIVWSANPKNPSAEARSCPAKNFLPLLEIPGVELYSLQKGAAAAEIAAYPQIQDAVAKVKDFADTAVVIMGLDLVITVDTAVAHLAGTMGTPVWVMLPFAPDWRWMLHRPDSPWYPTMRLFRQKTAGDWPEVFAQVREELARYGVGARLHQPVGLERKINDALPSLLEETSLTNPVSLTEPTIEQAVTHQRSGELETAEQIYRQILQQQPQLISAWNNLAILLKDMGRVAEAIPCYDQALALAPDAAHIHNNKANALVKLGELDAAISHYQQSIALVPDYADAYYGIGNALATKGELDAAVASYRKAIELNPNYTEAYNNLGNALQAQGKLEEAHRCYQRTLELYPNRTGARWNIAFTLLLAGKLREGFAEYEWRWQVPEFEPPRNFPQPLWDGSSLQGKTILIHTEQGFGDTIQFCRYIPIVAAKGGKVILECPESLIRLLQNLPGIHQIIPTGDNLPEFDCYAPLISLPHILGTTLETIPNQISYLYVNVRSWASAQKMNEHPEGLKPNYEPGPMKIGIVWAGKPFYLHDSKRYRSCSLSYFQELFAAVSAGKTGEIAVYSLQKEAAAPEWQEVQGGFTQMGDIYIEDAAAQINDFADTAAVIAQLDLIITVDTAVAHLAGAMGKPVWVLLPFAPDWRWMLQREDSPWYPTMRLFRQSKPGRWPGVFAQVQTALQLLLANRDKSAAELHKLGVMAYQQGEIETAIAYYRTGLILNPGLAKTHNNLAVALKQVGHLPEAISRYRIAIRLAESNGENLPIAEMYNNLGNALQSVRKFPEAVAAYQQALSLKPFAEAYNNLGNAYQEMGRLQDAISAYEQAISLKYRRPGGGTTPYLAEAHYNLGVALQATGNLAAAIVQYKKATAESSMPQAHINLGNALRELGRMDEAISAYKTAIQLHPEHPDAHWNLAVTLLLVGKLREGFAEYEWRWQTAKLTKRQFPQPQWDGSPLEGKTILIHPEQGLGDTIQFSRYIPLLTRMGGKVILECPSPLLPLFQTLPGCDSSLVELVSQQNKFSYENNQRTNDQGLLTNDQGQMTFDCHAPLMSLPHILGTTLETIPNDIPYLFPPVSSGLKPNYEPGPRSSLGRGDGLKPNYERVRGLKPNYEPGPRSSLGRGDGLKPNYERVRGLKPNYEPGGGLKPNYEPGGGLKPNYEPGGGLKPNYEPGPLKVGIVWAGNPQHEKDAERSTSLSHFLSLAEIPGVALYSLQKGAGAEQLTPEMPVEDLGKDLQDFADTAAAITQLDLIISVDTAVAHLAGAMGKPVWLLLPFAPDWRWLLQREDSPWYPTMRLFRQPKPGDWQAVFQRVKEQLYGIIPPLPNPSANNSTITNVNKRRIGIGWQLSQVTGWGIYGTNLALQLQRHPQFSPVLLMPPAISDSQLNPLHQLLLQPVFAKQLEIQEIIKKNQGKQIRCDFPVIHALGKNLATTAVPRGKTNAGAVFLEDTNLDAEALQRADNYDIIIAGSVWNEKILIARGISHAVTVQQGIDLSLFHPAKKSNLFGDRFVIFAGGKLEYRKGQDIVIAAFKEFRRRHPQALLVTAWHNFWPQYMRGLEMMGHVTGLPQVTGNGQIKIGDWLVANGLPPESFIDLGAVPNLMMPQIIREADVAVFASRCEGGTNLAAMECMACGIPTILSANTGHLDLIEDDNCYPLVQQQPVKPTPNFAGVMGWGESSVEELIETWERVGGSWEEARRRGAAAAQFMEDWTWEKQVGRLLGVLKGIL